uniref:Uncharacterized protein n=1 Tax=Crocodylus porosus TaxID=8502 RepID=A0A7M4FFK8_CROPO
MAACTRASLAELPGLATGRGPSTTHKSSPSRPGTHECRPCTPPSTCADAVLRSNFSSPEYIMALQGEAVLDQCQAQGRRGKGRRCGGRRVTGSGCLGSCPWRPATPSLGISLAGSHLRRSTHQGPPWWQPGESPSSLQPEKEQWVSKSRDITAAQARQGGT